ncbi:nucleoside recognition domain-containing protein [Umezakia ovalisporum]|jgi:spore maturation protein SpmA|uniref:Spore maturation protein n=1 Tax=Umezakia ovalisporum FSS-62 TaxID=2971776 RepID=A0AA43KG22_9CYAN|nr:nucleoside recognition domain-containing protein [Umezakia ovalisporum]MBI1240530.1 spore maturation protein [Nostoc sp. RI_552]MDH6065216.1 spore maturation protein [Umezakia ovalisporum FSS-62]MDH6067065.1 spore maturation protein [Umezakia ovalisporum APH033B]MDH6073239.1 spore maturation protein [Umezakia ovalisporum CS-1034]MDH6102440.1 spore maturation protein [Umezakia ovalisporum ANA283AFssAo]
MKKSSSPLNGIWLFLIVSATVVAAYNGKMSTLTEASFKAADSAVTLAIGLIGAMALWLGIMKVAETAGMMRFIARLIRPLMSRLFPEIPVNHPAMSAMVINMAANALGLGNAATPMGLKAMAELNKLNPHPGTATDAMCLFLAINTSSVTLLPLSVITVRASAGASNPAAIVLPSIIATIISTAIAIIASKLFARRASSSLTSVEYELETTPADSKTPVDETPESELIPPGMMGNIVFAGLIVAFLAAVFYRLSIRGLPYIFSMVFISNLSNWLLPILICLFLLFGYFRGVKVYEVLTEGAKEGFEIAIRIIPFLVAIFVAIGMFRASGALDILTAIFSPITSLITLPPEALPMALIRPLSGSGSFGLMSEIVKNDPDSFLSFLVSTMQGSTETTFYVMAVYFGSIGIVRTSYTIPAALCADAAGMLASLVICRLMF